MKIKKIVALLVALIICVCVFSGCDGGKLASSVLIDGNFRFKIIRSSDSGAVVQALVRELRSEIKKNFGCEVKVEKDNVDEEIDGDYEIIVGESNREASAIAKETLLNNRVNSANDFIVKVVDNKIAILALNETMTDVAVKWFIKNFCQSVKDFEKITQNYEFIYTSQNVEQNGFINYISNMDIGRFKVVLPRVSSYLVGRQMEYYRDLMSKYGYSVKIGEDFDQSEEFEILVGDTSRTESQKIKVEGDNFIIKVVGNKLIIKGGNVLADYAAAKKFFEIISEAETKNEGINWTDGYTVNGKYDSGEKGIYTLNFYDDFDSSTVDTTKWGSYRYPNKTISASSLGGKHYYTNIYGECDLPEAKGNNLIYTADGKLHLGSMRINDIDFVNSDISTIYTMSFRYGYVETKAKLAKEPASVSIWCNGSTNTTMASINHFGDIMNHSAMTEVDIIENFSSSYSFASNIHHWYNLYKSDGISTSGNGHNSLDGDSRYTGNSLNNKKFNYDSVKYGDTLSDDFHIYSLYWDTERMDFAFDGKRYFTYEFKDNTMASVTCGMLYYILGSQMGSPAYGTLYNKNTHPERCEAVFDYVKIYQSNDVNSQMAFSWPEKQEEKGQVILKYPDHSVNDVY